MLFAQRRRARPQAKPNPANKLCPRAPPVRIAWTIPWKVFGAQETDPPVPRVARKEPEHLKASARLGQPLSAWEHDIMALSAEQKYRFALRVIGFACTTFYVFIYGAQH